MSTGQAPRAGVAVPAALLAEAPPGAPGEAGAASALGADGLLLLDSIGWEPVELVSATARFSIPRGVWAFGRGENETVTRAHQRAAAVALARVADACRGAGGHGIVGAELAITSERHEASARMLGTAIRPADAGAAGAPADVFGSALSARDFVLLATSGWRPTGLCVGLSFVNVPWARRGGGRSTLTGNFELENFTQALYAARARAMERMQAAALATGASGVVGVTARQAPVAHAGHVLAFVATGTGARLEAEAHRSQSPRLSLPLEDGSAAFDARALRRQPGR